jgi:HK97 family phage portal protein
MGFWRTVINSVKPRGTYDQVQYYGLPGLVDEDQYLLWENPEHFAPNQLWITQPHLRTVVSFLCRNTAQLSIHTYNRVSDTDRQRDHDNLFARTMRQPDNESTAYELIFATVGDLCLYDRAHWVVGRTGDTPSGYRFRRVPPNWVTWEQDGNYAIKRYSVLGEPVPPENMLTFRGYSPTSSIGESSSITSLKRVLWEQIESARYRNQVWKRGGRVSSVLQRPAGAPEWTDGQRESFRQDWYATYTGQGPRAGGTPILEDGMTLNRIDFSARDMEFVEATKLALQTVAAVYHVNPTMVGLLDNANYSNVLEFRRMLYTDTLGPLLKQIESRINAFLLPRLEPSLPDLYAEFNVAEKLKGSFSEQAQALQTAVGRPWMTADEARGRLNLPSVGGEADQLVVPLNVLIGGTASTPQKSIEAKARSDDNYVEKHRRVLSSFFAHQESVVLTALGAKADSDWWDSDRWDGELKQNLFKLYLATSVDSAHASLTSAGISTSSYDAKRTHNFLDAVTSRVASQMNQVTKAEIDAARASSTRSVKDVFADARGARSEEAARTGVTFASAFGTTESARQYSGDKATKTWVVTSSNPRPSHQIMDGQTVPLHDTFSNGAEWPADSSLPVDEVAGCTCAVTVSY